MTDEVIDAPLDGGEPADTPTNDQQPPAGGADTPAGGDADLASGGGKEKPTAPADWPADWRGKLAGEDEKLAKRLERFKSPVDVWKSFLSAEQKISAGQMKPTLPENPSEEDLAAYRKELGVPEKPEGYLENLPNGLVIGDGDKELANSFIEQAHAANMPPEFVGAALNWYYQREEDEIARLAEADRAFMAASEDELRAEWGNDFRPIQNSVTNFMKATPVVGYNEKGKPITLGDVLLVSRTPDGRRIGNDPEFTRWFADLADKANPAGFVAPGAGDQAKSIDDEIAQIEEVMRTKRGQYDQDEKMQARFLKLIEAKERLAS